MHPSDAYICCGQCNEYFSMKVSQFIKLSIYSHQTEGQNSMFIAIDDIVEPSNKHKNKQTRSLKTTQGHNATFLLSRRIISTSLYLSKRKIQIDLISIFNYLFISIRIHFFFTNFSKNKCF